jgi:hypothetical protein
MADWKDDGGPAFARAGCQWTEDHGDGAWSQDGMSLRDYFAGQCIQGMIPQMNLHVDGDFAWAGRVCYAVADAMLKARQR